MKVKCIKNQGVSDWLTVGKIYEAIEEYDDGWCHDCYKIIDGNKNQYVIPKEFFKLLSENRNENINKLLGL